MKDTYTTTSTTSSTMDHSAPADKEFQKLADQLDHGTKRVRSSIEDLKRQLQAYDNRHKICETSTNYLKTYMNKVSASIEDLEQWSNDFKKRTKNNSKEIYDNAQMSIQNLQHSMEELRIKASSYDTRIKNTVQDKAEAARASLSSAKGNFTETIEHLVSKARQKANQGLELAQSQLARMQSNINNQPNNQEELEKTENTTDYLKEKANNAGEYIRDKAYNAKESLKSTANNTGTFLSGNTSQDNENIKSTANVTRDSTQVTTPNENENLKSVANTTRQEEPEEANQGVRGALSNAIHAVSQTVHDVAETVSKVDQKVMGGLGARAIGKTSEVAKHSVEYVAGAFKHTNEQEADTSLQTKTNQDNLTAKHEAHPQEASPLKPAP